MTDSVIEAIEKKLSAGLLPILEIELELGNIVARVESPKGTNYSFVVILKNKINHNEISNRLELSSQVKKWENKDRHYDLESGYVCNKAGHAIIGPL
jgi:hypothetical protein